MTLTTAYAIRRYGNILLLLSSFFTIIAEKRGKCNRLKKNIKKEISKNRTAQVLTFFSKGVIIIIETETLCTEGGTYESDHYHRT